MQRQSRERDTLEGLRCAEFENSWREREGAGCQHRAYLAGAVLKERIRNLTGLHVRKFKLTCGGWEMLDYIRIAGYPTSRTDGIIKLALKNCLDGGAGGGEETAVP